MPTYPTPSPCGHDVRSSLGLRAYRQPDKPVNSSGFHLASELVLVRLTQQLAIDPRGPSRSQVSGFWLQGFPFQDDLAVVSRRIGCRRFRLGNRRSPEAWKPCDSHAPRSFSPKLATVSLLEPRTHRQPGKLQNCQRTIVKLRSSQKKSMQNRESKTISFSTG